MGTPSDVEARLIGGRYRLIERIGQGGMGTIWRAHDNVLRRTVAVKEVDLPHLPDADRAQLRERTLREARAAAQLNHPNAVTVYDVVEEDGQPWIVMQLVAADSLADVVSDTGALPVGRVAEIGLAVLDALEAAHAAGILHRDVKPGNVLLGHDGRIVLTDFGIATLEGDSSLTSTGMLLGAPAYIAPERARGLRPGPASDLWSLGATLYTAVEGRPPFERDSPIATVTALMTEPPPPPESAGPLTPLLLGLLETDPDRRVDAAGARDLLQRALAAQPAVEQVPEPPPKETPVAPAVEAADRTQVIARPEPPHVPPPVATPVAAPVRPGGPARPPRQPGSRRALLAALIVAGVAAVIALVMVVQATGGNDPQARSSANPSAKGAASGSSSAARPTQSAGSASPATTGIPAGFVRYTDPNGFSVAVPAAWRRTGHVGSASDGQLDFRDPASSGRFLRFGYTTHPKDNPVADWTQQEKKLQSREGYRRLYIKDVSYHGWPTADWEFMLGSTRVRDRGFKVDASHGYAIYLSAPDSTWTDSLRYFGVAASTFKPAS